MNLSLRWRSLPNPDRTPQPVILFQVPTPAKKTPHVTTALRSRGLLSNSRTCRLPLLHAHVRSGSCSSAFRSTHTSPWPPSPSQSPNTKPHTEKASRRGHTGTGPTQNENLSDSGDHVQPVRARVRQACWGRERRTSVLPSDTAGPPIASH